MKTIAFAVLLSAAGFASACSSLVAVFPDVKEIAECVGSHELRITLQKEELDRWMGLQEKLTRLVVQQQDDIQKLRDQIADVKLKLAAQPKKR